LCSRALQPGGHDKFTPIYPKGGWRGQIRNQVIRCMMPRC
jgi:hypothetical protein